MNWPPSCDVEYKMVRMSVSQTMYYPLIWIFAKPGWGIIHSVVWMPSIEYMSNLINPCQLWSRDLCVCWDLAFPCMNTQFDWTRHRSYNGVRHMRRGKKLWKCIIFTPFSLMDSKYLFNWLKTGIFRIKYACFIAHYQYIL